MADRRGLLLLACDISAEQEEPWRRLLQELSDAGSKEKEEYAQSRRRLGISVVSVWLVPSKPRGGGLAVVYLEASDPERVLGELVESETPLETYYNGAMHKRLSLEVVRLPQADSGELLFAWRDDVGSEREEPKNP
jgi:hypothetical protein